MAGASPTYEELQSLLARLNRVGQRISWPPSILTAIFPLRSIIPKAHLLGDSAVSVYDEVTGNLDLVYSGDRAVACRRLKDRLGHPWYELAEMSEAGLEEVLTEDLRRRMRRGQRKESEQAKQNKEQEHQSFRSAVEDARRRRAGRPLDEDRLKEIAGKLRQLDRKFVQPTFRAPHKSSHLIVQAVTLFLEAVAAGWQDDDVEIVLNKARSYEEAFCLIPMQIQHRLTDSYEKSFCTFVAASIDVAMGGVSNFPQRFTTGTLARTLNGVVSTETIAQAAKAAGLMLPHKGDRSPWIGPREASIIATQREKRGFKNGERDEWERLLAHVGAPEIGSTVRAKSKSNPNTAH